MSEESKTQKTGRTLQEEIDLAIVGGGIAGLYCAFKYSGTHFKTIKVYEGSQWPGGRISTKYYPDVQPSDSQSEAPPPPKPPNEFYAEFGPMRIEPGQQELLHDLLNRLEIYEKGKEAPVNSSGAYLVDFPPYTSPADIHEPKYELQGEESDQRTPLDLLKLAFIRIFGRLVVQDADASAEIDADIAIRKCAEKRAFQECLEHGQRALMLAVASRQPDWQGSFQRWINQLEEEDYQNIREFSHLEYEDGETVPLWQMGFWNLMSDVLSHNALLKLRDLGTFYHLIEENPNAVEWLVFWLRGLKTTEKLQGIHGGMSTITELLEEKIKAVRGDTRIVETQYTLIRMEPKKNGSRTLLHFSTGDEKSPQSRLVLAKHVILAIPKKPLEKILAASGMFIDAGVAKSVDAVFGFPMVKVFVVVRERWWEEKYRANLHATRMPTRELHYWKSEIESKRLLTTALYRSFGERRVSITFRDGHFGRVAER